MQRPVRPPNQHRGCASAPHPRREAKQAKVDLHEKQRRLKIQRDQHARWLVDIKAKIMLAKTLRNLQFEESHLKFNFIDHMKSEKKKTDAIMRNLAEDLRLGYLHRGTQANEDAKSREREYAEARAQRMGGFAERHEQRMAELAAMRNQALQGLAAATAKTKAMDKAAQEAADNPGELFTKWQPTKGSAADPAAPITITKVITTTIVETVAAPPQAKSAWG